MLKKTDRWNTPLLLVYIAGKRSIQFSSVTQSCPTLCNPMDCSRPGFSVHHQFLELAQTHIHWVGDAIQPSYPVIPSPPVLNLSYHQGLFQWVSSLHQVAKVLELSFSISPSNEYSGLIFFRMDWFDLAVQGTLKSLLQHHNSKASILGEGNGNPFQCSCLENPRDRGALVGCNLWGRTRSDMTEAT